MQGHRIDKVAAAFSWIVGIGRVIYFWFVYFMDLQQINPWLFLVPLFYTIVDVGILIWRQADVSEGRKIPSGICTLIFCSLIGGILTICIPEADLYGYQGYMASKIFDEEGEKKELSEDEKIELIVKYKKLLDEGAITQEDFEAKKKDLLQ